MLFLTETLSYNHVASKRIAPGTDGAFDLIIDGSGSEVAIEYFIDLDVLINEGTITEEECNSYDWGSNNNYNHGYSIIRLPVPLSNTLHLINKSRSTEEDLYKKIYMISGSKGLNS